MTLRRIDPWSVLKFGAVVNVCLFVIGLLGFAILWFAIRQLGVIDQACDLATDVGFESCAINGGNLFRYVLLLGLLWVVIQTGLLVFFAFLHNLIADLVGGIEVTLSEEGAGATMTSRTARTERTGGGVTLGSPPPRDEQRTERAARDTAAAASGSAVASSTSGDRSGSSSGDDRADRPDRPDRAPSAPPTAAPRSSERAPTGSGWPWDPQPSRSGGSSPARPQDRSDQERSGQDRTEERRTADRDDDNLFGRRDR